jgi:cytochrome c-type biogenesis protein CcmH/NrfG
VRIVASGLLIAMLAILAAPEFPRYAAERRVGFATAAFRALVGESEDPETARNIAALGDLALTTVGELPGDPRPWVVAGSSCLVTNRPERALEFYREAFATGERAEIDLNLGRAYALLKRQDAEGAAFLRAGWISPEILASLPESVRAPLLAEVSRLSNLLRQGRLDAPPPVPPQERR